MKIKKYRSIQLLLDFKKSGDWGFSDYISQYNSNNEDNIMLVTGDYLCALHNIVLGLPTLFGFGNNLTGQGEYFGIYLGEEAVTYRNLQTEIDKIKGSLGSDDSLTIDWNSVPTSAQEWEWNWEWTNSQKLLAFERKIDQIMKENPEQSSIIQDIFYNENEDNLGLFNTAVAMSKIFNKDLNLIDINAPSALVPTLQVEMFNKFSLLCEMTMLYDSLSHIDVNQLKNEMATASDTFIVQLMTSLYNGFTVDQLGTFEARKRRRESRLLKNSIINIKGSDPVEMSYRLTEEIQSRVGASEETSGTSTITIIKLLLDYLVDFEIIPKYIYVDMPLAYESLIVLIKSISESLGLTGQFNSLVIANCFISKIHSDIYNGIDTDVDGVTSSINTVQAIDIALNDILDELTDSTLASKKEVKNDLSILKDHLDKYANMTEFLKTVILK